VALKSLAKRHSTNYLGDPAKREAQFRIVDEAPTTMLAVANAEFNVTVLKEETSIWGYWWATQSWR
jgi:hypothetical protein